MAKLSQQYNRADLDRIVEMAWEDRTSFDAIREQFEINESQVISLMRQSLKKSSFIRWRKRVNGRRTKHLKKRNFTVGIHKCSRQKSISSNKISKRNG